MDLNTPRNLKAPKSGNTRRTCPTGRADLHSLPPKFLSGENPRNQTKKRQRIPLTSNASHWHARTKGLIHLIPDIDEVSPHVGPFEDNPSATPVRGMDDTWGQGIIAPHASLGADFSCPCLRGFTTPGQGITCMLHLRDTDAPTEALWEGGPMESA